MPEDKAAAAERQAFVDAVYQNRISTDTGAEIPRGVSPPNDVLTPKVTWNRPGKNK